MLDVHLAAPTACDELRQMFLDACAQPTSIHQHLTVLRDTASGCRHITEFGVGEGWSTLAWLLVQPDKLLCVDLGFQACVPVFERLRGRTDFVFWVGDARLVAIEETDLLFIDTIHARSHLEEELRVHADKARRFIVLHDTDTFGRQDEAHTPGQGLLDAVDAWLPHHPEWRIAGHWTHNNGLTILQRG